MSPWYKEKIKIKLVLDAFMFLALMSMAGIGFLIKFVLVPGDKRNLIYGTGVDLTFLGWDRHQWGTVHLIVSLSFMFLLLIHILLNWQIIVCIFRRMVSAPGLRKVLALVFALICIGLVIVPWFINPELVPLERKHRREFKQSDASRNESMKKRTMSSEKVQKDTVFKVIKEPKHQHQRNQEIEVYGYMTLQEVADKYDVPVHNLAQFINIPDSEKNYRLGRLRKQYDFHMSDVREAVLTYRASQP